MFGLPPLPRTLTACERDLSSQSGAVRVSVARDLARSSDNDAEAGLRYALLERCLKDPDAAVRRQGLLSVADLKARSLMDRVMGMLSDSELEVRQMAVLALGEIAEPEDEAALGRVASLLKAGASPIRYQALLAYTNLCPAHSAPDLESALADTDVEIRKLAVRLVDEVLVARKEVIPDSLFRALEDVARSPHRDLAVLAQMVCADLGLSAPTAQLVEVVNGTLKVSEPRDEQWAIELCGRLRVAAAERGLRRRAFGWLGRSGDPFRYTALSALAKWGDARALVSLQRQLRAHSYVRRAQALQALGGSGQESARAMLAAHRATLDEERSQADRDELELVSRALAELETELGDAI